MKIVLLILLTLSHIKYAIMKRLSLTLFIILTVLLGYSQITISEADMPSPGDTIRISNGIEFLGDASETGTNHIWDYSNLEAINQYVDSFIDPIDAPIVHSVVFNLPWDPDHATVALMQDGAGEIATGISMEEMYNFFSNDESSYRHVGFGASISGVPMPVKFDSPDIYFEYPLEYLNTYSSLTEYELSLPTIGFFSEIIDRENIVDGWGTLILPMGSYEVLRVKSEVTRTDSIYYDAMGIGFALPPMTTIEYKWVGIGMGEPLLQIDVSTAASTVYFQDIAIPDTSSQAISEINLENKYTLYPNPTNGIINISTKEKNIEILEVEVIDISGRMVSILSRNELNYTDKIISLKDTPDLFI